MKRAAYGNSRTSDLWDALSEDSRQSVAKIMATWTQKVGYPVVHVDEDASGENITVTQHRFLQDGAPDPEDDKVLYPLKLRIRTMEGVDDKIDLYDRTSTLKVASEFFKLDADHPGLYCVLYTPKRLQILGENAKDGLLRRIIRLVSFLTHSRWQEVATPKHPVYSVSSKFSTKKPISLFGNKL